MKRQIAVPVAVALACTFADVYLIGVPITMWGLALLALVRLVQLFAAGRGAPLAVMRAKHVVIYGAGVALIFLGITGNVKLAASRGARVADAVKQYRAVYGDYPKRLEQLVPAYLPEIPSCCIRANNLKFRYYRPPGNRTLFCRGPLWFRSERAPTFSRLTS
jgi:hypothetical protein